jgi:hypothetical protein
MTATTTCVRCGALLPAVPADPQHPDWCPTCAARAVGGVGAAPVPESTHAAGTPWPPAQPGLAPTVPPYLGAVPAGLGARSVDAVLLGIAAAAVSGVAWWAVSAVSHRQFPYLALLPALFVGQAVLIGARRGGPLPAAVAAVSVLVALVVAEYFVQRSLAIANFGVDVPLWMGFTDAKDIVVEGVKQEKLTGIFWAVATIAAAATTFPSGRRAIL